MITDDTPLAVLRRARSFFSGTSLSRLTGMIRDILMAAAFGATASVAAFMVAFRLAHLLRRILGEGALQAAFIPQFEEERQWSEQNAIELFRNLLSTLIVSLSGLILVAEALLIGLYFSRILNPGNQEIIYLLLWSLPGLFFVCLFGVQASLLQCEGRYFIPSVAPVAFNLVWIAAVLFLWHIEPAAAMPWLAAAVSFGCFLQWLITLPAILEKVSLRRLFSSWNPSAPSLRRLFRALLLGLAGVSASQLNAALDVLFARYADSAGPAYLWYAIRLQQLPLGLFGVALSGALLPSLSRAVKRQQFQEGMHLVQKGLTWAAWVMIPMTVGIFIFGPVSIQLLYGHGDFSLADGWQTTLCLWGYGLGLLPMTFVLVLAPFLYSAGHYSITAKGSVLSVALNIALNAFFILVFHWGPESVALATSMSAGFNAAYLWVNVKRWRANDSQS